MFKATMFFLSVLDECTMSATRPTTSSGWKLLIRGKFEMQHLRILMFKHKFRSQ